MTVYTDRSKIVDRYRDRPLYREKRRKNVIPEHKTDGKEMGS